MISDKRILRVIEHIATENMDLDGKNKFAEVVYRFSHLAGNCEHPHEDWHEEFLKCERELAGGNKEPSRPPAPIKRPSSISI